MRGSQPPAGVVIELTSRAACDERQKRRKIMKVLMSAMIALSVVAGLAAAPASAEDSRQFWQNYDRTHSGN
jgi:hypothetical protein